MPTKPAAAPSKPTTAPAATPIYPTLAPTPKPTSAAPTATVAPYTGPSYWTTKNGPRTDAEIGDEIVLAGGQRPDDSSGLVRQYNKAVPKAKPRCGTAPKCDDSAITANKDGSYTVYQPGWVVTIWDDGASTNIADVDGGNHILHYDSNEGIMTTNSDHVIYVLFGPGQQVATTYVGGNFKSQLQTAAGVLAPSPTPAIVPTPTVAPAVQRTCYVNGYTRKNGTQVGGYFRRC